MERGDWENDADYPGAPLPAHERTWRHPSELGADQWVQSEPPLVVGRGLSVATGVVGAVLALGLLWLMVPRPGRGSEVAIEVSSTSVRSAAQVTPPASRVAATTTPITEAVPESLALSGTGTSDAAITTDVRVLSVPTSNVASSPPAPTMVLGSTDEVSEAILPVAVALTPGHLVVTTAAAVRGREGFTVQLPSGETVVGAVVWVDVASGTAVLSVTADIDQSLIEASQSELSAGDFMVMTPEATSASLWVDDNGTQVGYPDSTATGEGSLVLDGDGRLMGMCTKSATGVHLVTVATLLDALTSAAANGTPAWLGIKADVDAIGRVTVAEVFDGSPAAVAGLQVGDVIVDIDGVPLSDPETLRSVLSAHGAGETVTLTIEKASDETTATTIADASSPSSGSTSTGSASTSPTTNSGSEASTASPTTPGTSQTETTVPSTESTVTPNTTIDVVITLSQPPGSL